MKGTILAVVATALMPAASTLAQQHGGPATLSSPSPTPPPRPDDLTDRPVDAPPLPPQRPSELTASESNAAHGEQRPTPPPRPAELGGAAVATSVDTPLQQPAPPARPVELGGVEGEASGETPPLPPERPDELSAATAEAAVLAVPEDAACLKALETLGVGITKLPPIVNGQCTVAHPLALRTIARSDGNETVALTADQIVVCGVAQGLGLWTQDARNAADTELGDRLTGLDLGGGYVCRGQNHVGEAKLSEHAFANAIDVMGFNFAKHAPIAVGSLPDGSPEARFLDRVRGAACRHFRTVLGPGSNETHANHLHFDQRERAGGHRLCELRPDAAKEAAPAQP